MSYKSLTECAALPCPCSVAVSTSCIVSPVVTSRQVMEDGAAACYSHETMVVVVAMLESYKRERLFVRESW